MKIGGSNLWDVSALTPHELSEKAQYKIHFVRNRVRLTEWKNRPK